MKPESQPQGAIRRPRLDFLDAIRGLVMVVMALDHTRDYFSNATSDPLDAATTTPALFFTRWITHFCAPIFVFLAGTGAYLYGQRTTRRGDLSRFLWTRGLWLVVLEVTLVAWGWHFRIDYSGIVGQVIWALGASMIVLAALVHLPVRWIAAFGLILIVGHNALDGIQFPPDDWRFVPWAILHTGAPIRVTSQVMIFPLYPLIPWVGVMAAGFAFGTVVVRPAAERRKWFLRLGAAMIAAFVLLRLLNLYGESQLWTARPTPFQSLFSFLNCSKYPPSLLYLLMTLGPAMLLLAWADAAPGQVPQWLVVFGRVPMFYYLLHLYVIHAAAGVTANVFGRSQDAAWIWRNPFFDGRPDGYGYPLWAVYIAWILIVAGLYPICRWYAGVKQRSKHPLLSYL